MLEKLLLALIVTLCLNLLVVVRLSNKPDNTTSSFYQIENATRKKWFVPMSSNWQSATTMFHSRYNNIEH